MNNMKKFFIALAILLLVAGSGICITILAMNEFNYRKVINSTVVENTKKVEGIFSNIEVSDYINDIELVYITEGEEKVVTKTLEDFSYDIKVENDTLYVISNNNRKWYEFYTWVGTSDCKTTIYVKNNIFNNFKCKVETGDIILKNYSFKSLSIEMSTGDATLENINVENDLVLSSSTGDIITKNVNVNGNLNVKASTGDIVLDNDKVLGNTTIKTSTGSIKFDKFDAQKIEASTSTGSINGSLVGDHNYEASSSTGSTSYPTPVGNAPLCKLSSSTGSITITKA